MGNVGGERQWETSATVSSAGELPWTVTVNLLLQLNLEGKLLLLFLLGIVVAGQLNRAIYRLAHFQRSISPWSFPPDDALPRRWFDRLPVVGWWSLRREAGVHGRFFWLRPMLVELSTGIGLAALYWYEVEHRGLAPVQLQNGWPITWLHAEFASHSILFALLIVATFIDIDEKTIPEEITDLGAIFGLLLAAVAPRALLPDAVPAPLEFLAGTTFLTSPNAWTEELNGPRGLVIGLACYLGWCYAIAPKIWWTRGGLRKALRLLWGSMMRPPVLRLILIVTLIGSAGVTLVWKIGGLSWQGMLTALVGMAFAGGLVWAVRVIGSFALGREAMGFGDVTLMAMIGAFVGWQASLIIFFIAPLAGLVLALLQWILTGRRDIPYGPFLAFATLLVVLGWDAFWFGYARPVFALGWWIPGIVICCLALMAGMLTAWRYITDCWRSD